MFSKLNRGRKRSGRGRSFQRFVRETHPTLERLEERLLLTISGTGYYGMDYNSSLGMTPPDTVTAAGPNYVLEADNTNLYIASKAGLPNNLSGSVVSFQSFFPGITHSTGGLYDVISDPSVNYDASTGKWTVSILDVDTQHQESYLNVAVSDTSDPTGSWTKSQINLTDGHGPLIPGNSGLTLWGDFDRFGSSADAYVWTVNMFSFSSGGIDQNSLYDHVQVIAMDKSNPANIHTVDLPSWDANTSTITNENLIPVRMDAPTAADGMWFAEETNYGDSSGQADTLRLVHVADVLTATPSDFVNFTGNVPLYQFNVVPDPSQGGNHPWNNGDSNAPAGQKGSTDLISTNDTRIDSAVWRTVNGQQHLVLTQTVDSPADPGVAKARWYDFNTTHATNPAVAIPLYQSGEINPGSGVSTYFPSAAIDPAGDIGMSYLESSATSPGEYLSMYVTGKQLTDTTMQPATLVVAGNSALTGPDGSPHRAGDFSGTVEDINSAGATMNSFWSANEYAKNSAWGTALENYTVGSPPPATDMAVTVSGPSSVTLGTNATYTITITNNGPNAAQGVLLNDTLPTGSQFVSMAQTLGTDAFTLTQSGGSVTETANSNIASGSSDTFTVVVYVPYGLSDGAAFNDTATVSAASPDPNLNNNSATANGSVVVGQPPAELQDTGFELPSLGSGKSAYQYDPSGSPWSFVGQSGVSGNDSDFTSGNPAAPQGSQVAFLQNAGSFSQQVTLSAGTYAISFSAAQRATYQSSSQTFQVLVDGNVVGTFTPSGTSYATLTSGVFTVTSGVHTITFVGLNPNGGDNTALIDQVVLGAAPLPPAQLQDTGFESPSVGSGASAYQYDPTGASWSFVGQSGVSGNSSAFTSGNPAAPQGSQVAFLQNAGSFSQQVTLSAGTYAIGFSAAQRASYQSSSQTFQVRVDGVTVATFSPYSTSYATYTTGAFTVGDGIHTITFVGLNPNGGDNTAFIDQVTLSTVPLPPAQLQDTGFETPSVGSGAYQYDPTASSWTFVGQAGVAGNDSPFTSGNPVAPQGSQVAFLQNVGSFSQQVTLAAGTYSLSFSAAQRAMYQSTTQTFNVLIDGVAVRTFTPSGTSYATYTTGAFTLSAGIHTITFVGLNPNGGDNTALIDQVTLSNATPPAQLQDGSFETPSVVSATSAYQYDPAPSAWSFVGQAGISGNNSAFTSSNPSAPQGSQVAFLQNTGSFSQAVTLAAGTYSLSFSAAQRAMYQSTTQTFQVLIDGVAVRTFTPSGTTYATYTTGAFTVAAGVHTITFVGLNPNGGDNTALIDQVTLSNATPPSQLQDTGFETPSVGSGASAYLYDPTASAWSFVGQAGVSGNGSDFTSGNPNAPQGSQVAFLQNTGSFSQAVTLAAGTYSISFSAAQRANHQSSSQTFQVLVDGVVVGTFTPSGTSYATYTASFTVTPGVHTITFVGLNPNGGDNTAFIDQVTISATSSGPALHDPTLGLRILGHGESQNYHSKAMDPAPDWGWWMSSGFPADWFHQKH